MPIGACNPVLCLIRLQVSHNTDAAVNHRPAKKLRYGEAYPRKNCCIVATFFAEFCHDGWQPTGPEVAAFLSAVQRHATDNLTESTAMGLTVLPATVHALPDTGVHRVELKVRFDAEFNDNAAHDEITAFGVANRLKLWIDLAVGRMPAIPSTLSAALDVFRKRGWLDTLREQLQDPDKKRRLCDQIRQMPPPKRARHLPQAPQETTAREPHPDGLTPKALPCPETLPAAKHSPQPVRALPGRHARAPWNICS